MYLYDHLVKKVQMFKTIPTNGTKYSRTHQVNFGRQPIKNLKWYGLTKAGHTTSNFLKAPQILFGSFLNTLSRCSYRV